MRDLLCILGEGGHGLDVAGTGRAAGWDIAFYDDDPERGHRPLGSVVFDQAGDSTRYAVVGVNDPNVRAAIVARHRQIQRWVGTLIHPQAIGEPLAAGWGCVISPGAVITENVHLGDHVHVNVGATLSQTTKLGDFVTVSPGAHICGEVTIGDRSWIGAGAIIKDHISIGSDVLVGCGAVVVEDIPDGPSKFVGVPARAMNDHSARQVLAAQDRLASR